LPSGPSRTPPCECNPTSPNSPGNKDRVQRNILSPEPKKKKKIAEEICKPTHYTFVLGVG